MVLIHVDDRREILLRIVRQVRNGERVERHRVGADQAQRVAVRLRDLAHSLPPSTIAAPGLLITTTGWPSRSCNSCAVSRAATSVTEPTEIGTIILIGLFG